MKKINWYKLLLYISFVFLAFSLYKANYLVIPEIHSFSKLFYSFIYLFVGTLIMCKNWQDVLNSSLTLKISFSSAIVSNGLSIFTKYIPGKLMVIIGRALYISKKYNAPLKSCSLASLHTQIITLWFGFAFGLSLFLFIEPNLKYISFSILLMMFFSIFLFSKKLKGLLNLFSKKLINKEFDYPIITLIEFIKVSPSFIFNWGFWILGFYFLAQAITTIQLPLLTGLIFPLAATFAIVALISPGGLGVREGIITITLIALGIDKQVAISISLASRLWFLVGELFIFITALILKKYEF